MWFMLRSVDMLGMVAGAVCDEFRSGVVIFWCVQARLDELLPLSEGDNRLKLRRSESVHMASLTGNQYQCLGASERSQFISLRFCHTG
jgi:hypothetical protein